MGARVARADDVDRDAAAVPGTFGDPLRALELSPAFSLVPADDIASGIAIRDADPSRVKLFVDGFEVPTLLAGGRALYFGDVSSVRRFDDGMDFGYGGATGGGLEITTEPWNRNWTAASATVTDAGLVYSRNQLFGGAAVEAARFAFLTPERGRDLALATANEHFDLQYRLDWRLSSHWSLMASAFGTVAGVLPFARATLTARYRDRDWQGLVAASSLISGDVETIDTRAELERELRDTGGLKALQLRLGENTSIEQVATSVSSATTQLDGGVWAAAGAALASNVAAIAGARLEIFDRQVALSPRGTVAALFGHIGVAITADAYRQAQVDRDATPERATEVVGLVQRRWASSRLSVTGYYIDRSRILVAGRAAGVGTAAGIELRESIHRGPWSAYFAAAISHATRADRATAPDHLADLDVPVRYDAMGAWTHGSWRLGARVQLRAGLPYSPVTGSIYDADTDTFSALYGKPNSARAPFRRELDLRIDRQLGRRLHAYLDLVVDGGVLGYTYSEDFSDQLAVRAPPVIPWAGITGQL